MNPDRYTKLCLTVIAVALVWLCVRDTAPVVHAGAGQENVRILGIDSQHPLEVKIVAIERGQWTEKPGPFDTVQRSQPWQDIGVITR